ncbi:MAG: hypothetical protein AAF637_27485 [Pseudomonadota bacterium]
MTQVALITGFEAYGVHARNPAGEIAARLNGTEVAGARVVGRTLPVAFASLANAIDKVLAEVDPALVISLGLCPGEPVVRLERVGINLADLDIPDNEGLVQVDRPIEGDGASARFSTLPMRAIHDALLEAGIPARLSNTAGTYLCNMALYRFLGAIEQRGGSVPCGFVHLPYLPEQVAAALAESQRSHNVESYRPTNLASMDLAAMIEAVRIGLEVSLTTIGPARG